MSSSFELQYVPETWGIGAKTSDFLFLNEIGRGSFGIVCKVQSLIDNNIYAIKKLDLKNMKEKNIREALDEVAILRRLDHPHIIKYYSYCKKILLFIYRRRQSLHNNGLCRGRRPLFSIFINHRRDCVIIKGRKKLLKRRLFGNMLMRFS